MASQTDGDERPDNVVRLSDVRKSIGDRRPADAPRPITMDAASNRNLNRARRAVGNPRAIGRKRVYASSQPSEVTPRPRRERLLFLGLAVVVATLLFLLWFIPHTPPLVRELGGGPVLRGSERNDVLYVTPLEVEPSQDKQAP